MSSIGTGKLTKTPRGFGKVSLWALQMLTHIQVAATHQTMSRRMRMTRSPTRFVPRTTPSPGYGEKGPRWRVTLATEGK